jgi:hypothetical protein
VNANQEYSAAEVERMMKLQDILLKAMAGKMHWFEAAEIIGVTARTMRRWRERLSANLASFTNDQWKDLLRTVVQSVTFQGHGIVIRGRIPISDTGDPGAPVASVPARS